MKNFNKKICVVFLLFAILISNANAQDNNQQDTTKNEQDNTRTSIHFHPVSLLAGAAEINSA